MATDPQKVLERWFSLLVKHKFGIAAIPVAGMAIGLFIAVASQAFPAEARGSLQASGLFLVQYSVYLFLAASVVFIVLAIVRR
jgi:hypothetical protein